jgi:hypothetical protein
VLAGSLAVLGLYGVIALILREALLLPGVGLAAGVAGFAHATDGRLAGRIAANPNGG